MLRGVHTVVQNPHNVYAIGGFAEIDDMTLNCTSSVTQPYMVTGDSPFRSFGQSYKSFRQLVE